MFGEVYHFFLIHPFLNTAVILLLITAIVTTNPVLGSLAIAAALLAFTFTAINDDSDDEPPLFI